MVTITNGYSLVIADQFFTFGGVCTKPMPTDIPNPSLYLPRFPLHQPPG